MAAPLLIWRDVMGERYRPDGAAVHEPMTAESRWRHEFHSSQRRPVRHAKAAEIGVCGRLTP